MVNQYKKGTKLSVTLTNAISLIVKSSAVYVCVHDLLQCTKVKSLDTISMQSVFVAWIKVPFISTRLRSLQLYVYTFFSFASCRISDFIIFINRMQPFPRDNSSVSVIYLLFGHFSYVIRFGILLSLTLFFSHCDLFAKPFPISTQHLYSSAVSCFCYGWTFFFSSLVLLLEFWSVLFRFLLKIDIMFSCDLQPYWNKVRTYTLDFQLIYTCID